jgi:hypothetical protein
MTEFQPVADGRAQANRLRPLGVKRGIASPRYVIPDPTPAQLDRLARERRAYSDPADALRRVRGVVYPDGQMIIEFRIYNASPPYRRQAVRPDGRVSRTATRNYGYPRTWRVVRGATGRKPLAKDHLPERIALGLLRETLTIEEAADRGWSF